MAQTYARSNAAWLALAAAQSLSAAPVVVDGIFDDWADAPPAAADPSGDSLGVMDVTRLHARTEGTYLYLRFDTTAEVNLQAGPAGELPLLVEIDFSGDRTLIVNPRIGELVLNPSGAPLAWESLDLASAPTHSSTEFEMRLNLAGAGAAAGDTVRVNFSGSDALAEPIVVTLDQPPPPAPERRSPARPAGATFRIVSLETAGSGLTHPPRTPSFTRLARAAVADIYCFQGEAASSRPAVEQFLFAADPTGDGSVWHAVKNHGCVVATRGAILALPAYNSRYAAAVCALGGEAGDVAVISFHPAGGGHVGSAEDQQRIAQTNDMLRTIRELREARLGKMLAPYRDAPVVVVGDWNLVGSRTPMTMVERPPAEGGAGLRWELVRHLIGPEVHTWRDAASRFTPAPLDLAAFAPESIRRAGGFILDTAALNEAELASMGLEAADSAASDHLMLVLDFAPAVRPCPADATGDRRIGLEDAAAVILAWGDVGEPGTMPADVDASGDVGLSDLTMILDRWAAPCDPG